MWLWLDKSVMDYTNWAEGQPYSNNYGVIGARDGKWSAGSKWNDRPYICKTAKGETIILMRTQLLISKCVTHIVLKLTNQIKNQICKLILVFRI